MAPANPAWLWAEIHLDDEHDAIPEALGCIGKAPVQHCQLHADLCDTQIKAWVKEMYGVDLRALAVWRLDAFVQLLCSSILLLQDLCGSGGAL